MQIYYFCTYQQSTRIYTQICTSCCHGYIKSGVTSKGCQDYLLQSLIFHIVKWVACPIVKVNII